MQLLHVKQVLLVQITSARIHFQLFSMLLEEHHFFLLISSLTNTSLGFKIIILIYTLR